MRRGLVRSFAVCGVVFGSFEPKLRAAFFVNKIVLMYNGKRLSMIEYRSIE